MKKLLCTAILLAIPVLAFAASSVPAQAAACGASGAQCGMMGAAMDHSQCALVQAAPSSLRAERDGRK